MRALLLALAFLCSGALAQVYRWVDSKRMEERLARREAAEARASAERTALTPPPPRGLEFRKYVSIQRGMSEGEMLTIAGPPDLLFRDFSYHTYTYLPIVGDPFITTITVVSGRVREIERVRKF
jgi:hypothetical protein